MYTESQIPRSKLRGIKLVSQQSCGVFDPRGSRQMDMQACPLGSLPAGIKKETAIPEERSVRFRSGSPLICIFLIFIYFPTISQYLPALR